MSLLQHPDIAHAVAWLRALGARALVADSRRVQPGDAFVAWPGYGRDGREFVAAAMKAGAVACLVEADGVEAYGFDDPRIASLAGLKAATGPLADRYWDHPSARLRVIAVTGTNGKTSVSWWMAQGLSLLGRRCGVVGTLGVGEPPSAASPQAAVVSTGLTTPDPLTLQASLRRFADQGFVACAMEASSIGLVEHRLDGTDIAVALYTNFTRDHLDFHRTMDAYWDAKAMLFRWPGLRAAVLNLDDERGAQQAQRMGGTAVDLWTYSVRGAARLQAREVGYVDGGLGFTLVEGAEQVPVRTGLIGDYNVSNVLAVIGGLRALQVPLADAAQVCAQLTAVPGRMQRVASPNVADRAPVVVVDYAHTPDALDKALQALRPLARERGGALWSVFGCGGNRDATKRPLMGAIAEREADHVIVTSDNPRHEDLQAILTQIAAGMARADRAAIVEDRRAAIVQAVREADARDVILVAGKGHEAEQEIAGVKYPFSDVQEALAALAARAAAPVGAQAGKGAA